MEKHKTPGNLSEWTIEKVKQYLKQNPEKSQHLIELKKIPEKERLEKWVGLLKPANTVTSNTKEFIGFAMFTLGLRDSQLDDLLKITK